MMKSVALSESCLYPNAADDDFVIVDAPTPFRLVMDEPFDDCDDQQDDDNSYDYCEDVFGALDGLWDDRVEEQNRVLIETSSMTSSFLLSEHRPQLAEQEATPTIVGIGICISDDDEADGITSSGEYSSSEAPFRQSSDDENCAPESPKNSDASLDQQQQQQQQNINRNSIEDTSSGAATAATTTTPTTTTTTTTKLVFKRLSNKKRRKQLKLARKVASSTPNLTTCANQAINNDSTPSYMVSPTNNTRIVT